MEIISQAYNQGDLVVIKHKDYHSVHACGTHAFIGSVVFYGNGYELRNKYGEELRIEAGGEYIRWDLYGEGFEVEDLKKYIIVAPFDRAYAMTYLGGSYLGMDTFKVAPVHFQRDSIFLNLYNDNKYKLCKIQCTFHIPRSIKKDIFFHLRDEESERTVIEPYRKFIKNYEVCGQFSE